MRWRSSQMTTSSRHPHYSRESFLEIRPNAEQFPKSCTLTRHYRARGRPAGPSIGERSVCSVGHDGVSSRDDQSMPLQWASKVGSLLTPEGRAEGTRRLRALGASLPEASGGRGNRASLRSPVVGRKLPASWKRPRTTWRISVAVSSLARGCRIARQPAVRSVNL